MPKIKYESTNLRSKTLKIIKIANAILQEYSNNGYHSITLRMLFYQFVSRALIPNNQREYKKLGEALSSGRRCGLIDWDFMIDRTRFIRHPQHWSSPSEIIHTAASSYDVDWWMNQEYRPECFTPETPVITKNGTCAIASLEVGDEVLTHLGRFRKVTKVIATKYRGMMLRVKCAGLNPFMVTGNHMLFAKPCDDSFKYKGSERRFFEDDWVSSSDLKKFDRLTIPMLSEIYESRRLIGDSINIVGGPRSKEYTLTVDESFVKVLGLYAAEGSVRPDGRTVQFTHGSHEEHYANLVIEWADSVGIPHHKAYGEGTCIVYLFSKALAMWIGNNFGSGAYNKKVPTWLFVGGEDFKIVFLEYYFRGDGCFFDESRAAIAATSRSNQLAQQIQLMLLWSGYAAAIDDVMDHGELRYRVSVGGASSDSLAEAWNVQIPVKGIGRSRRYNHIKIDDRFTYFPVRSVLSVPYSGTVYNLEVEEDHSYCTPVSSHNCWIEKDALVGIIEKPCLELKVPYFSCRGYISDSEIWSSAQRFREISINQKPLIIHLGDHDPSGLNMTEDVVSRLAMYAGRNVEVRRIALNYDQVEKYNPPPNTAKITDSRFQAYEAEYGKSSWELDALSPEVIDKLVRDEIKPLIDWGEWEKSRTEVTRCREQLKKLSNNWDSIAKKLDKMK